jgi:hypothetical protein
MNRKACSGNEKLNKKAFLSMIGVSKFIKPNFNFKNSIRNQEINKIKKILEENNGNKQKTAAMLGISVSSLKRKLNNYENIVEIINEDQIQSPTPSRRYFENLKTDWEITSFDYQTREVCININAKPGIVRLSVVVPPLFGKPSMPI